MSTLKQDLRDGSKLALATIVGSALLLVVALVVSVMFVFGLGWFSKSTANFRGGVSATNQVNGNGSYRIAAYDHFYDLCAAVQTDELTIDMIKSELGTTKDQQRLLVLHASLDAATIKRGTDINQYNADARKSRTLGQFKASDLPYPLDPAVEATTCHA